MITAFTGLTGSGKTLSMVGSAFHHWKLHKRPVYANFYCRFPLLPFGKAPPALYTCKQKILSEEFETNPNVKLGDKGWFYEVNYLPSGEFIDKLLTTKNGLFLVDEAGFVFNSRKWSKLPFDLVARFQQSRKLGVDIMYTTQNIKRVDTTLRELTHLQVMCAFDRLFLTKKDFFLRNRAYYNPIIDHDTTENRKLWKAYEMTIFFNEFQKWYQYYDTTQLVEYSVGSSKVATGGSQ